MSNHLYKGTLLAVRRLGEFIHVSAVYIGLAVITSIVLSMLLPSMRQQSQQIYTTVLALFQASDQNDGFDSFDEAQWLLQWQDDIAQTAQQAAGDDVDQADYPVHARTEFALALAASLADRPLVGVSDKQRHALASYIARKYRIARSVADAIVRTAFGVARDLQLDPQLMLAVIAIESSYNPFVESGVGAQGLMQVMTRVHKDKLQERGGPASIFDPAVNMWVGGEILADCIRRRGSVQKGLACYVGATGPGDGGYGARVLAERRRLALASGLAPEK